MPCKFQRKIRPVNIPKDWRERALKARSRVQEATPEEGWQSKALDDLPKYIPPLPSDWRLKARPPIQPTRVTSWMLALDSIGHWGLVSFWIGVALYLALN